ncbi:MAG: Rhs family protein, partial [Myxococcaceae bacterium]|nr:Rhs family protein [Myxococcaceae bacterium]
MGFSLALGALSGCAADASDEAAAPERPRLASSSEALFSEKPRVLNIIAHHDDDIFAMNPDLGNTIQAAAEVHTVVVTSGENEAACPEYVKSREQGQQAAWDVMAGIASGPPWPTWAESGIALPVVPARTVRAVTMPGRANLGIVYLGLRNNVDHDVEKLWSGTATSIPLFNNAAVTYTRKQLIDTLVELLKLYKPTHVNILDSTKLHGTDLPDENSDHVYAALFALSALERWPTGAPTVRMFRTYNALTEAENVAPVDEQRKLDLYNAYGPFDPYLCQGVTATVCNKPNEKTIICNDPAHVVYANGDTRQYPISLTKNVSGPMRAPNNQCLRASGSQLATGPCTTPETWSLLTDGTLKHQAGLCAAANVADATVNPRNTALKLVACNAADARQRMFLDGAGQLRGFDATCVSAANPAALTLVECSAVAAQQGFNIQFSNSKPANALDFSAASLPTAYAASLTYGDLNADGKDDVCFKRSAGVSCALNNGDGTFGVPFTQNGPFSDASGYGSADTLGTLQLANVDFTTRASLCARRADGVYCALYTVATRQFAAPTKRSTGTDFSNDDGLLGYDFTEAYWGSIRLSDVTNDGLADLCGHNAEGIECAVNGLGKPVGTFPAATQWSSDEFTDALGWS